MLHVLRALVWLGLSTGLLLAGFAVFGTALLIPAVVARGELPGPAGKETLDVLYLAIASTALLPELLLTFVTWLAVARAVPALDRSRVWQSLGLFAVAAAWFPYVGRYWFTMWEPTRPSDYLATLFLVAGGASLALLLARFASPALAPGQFTWRSDESMVTEP